MDFGGPLEDSAGCANCAHLMTTTRILQWPCPSCHGPGGRSRRLAGLLVRSREEGSHQSPTRAHRAARSCRSETVEASDPTPTLDCAWRIRFRRRTIIPMVHLFFMARLWTSLRAAVHEFKISRMTKRSNSRFRVVEVRKCGRRRLSTSGCGRNQLSRSFRRRGVVAASIAGLPTSPANANARWEFVSSGGDDDDDDEEEEEEIDVSVNSIAPINWTRWKETEIAEFSPQGPYSEIAARGSMSKSMEDLGSLNWENNFLTTSASTRSLHHRDTSAPNTPCFEHRRFGNRLSNDSPQLVQPVRGKLATLSSLLRTMSDRYARRTGKLTPLRDVGSKQQRHLLKPSHSAAPFFTQPTLPRQPNLFKLPKHPKEQNTNSSSSSRNIDDVPVRRYDNPFQDFLRRSSADRSLRSAYEGERER